MFKVSDEIIEIEKVERNQHIIITNVRETQTSGHYAFDDHYIVCINTDRLNDYMLLSEAKIKYAEYFI